MPRGVGPHQHEAHRAAGIGDGKALRPLLAGVVEQDLLVNVHHRDRWVQGCGSVKPPPSLLAVKGMAQQVAVSVQVARQIAGHRQQRGLDQRRAGIQAPRQAAVALHEQRHRPGGLRSSHAGAAHRAIRAGGQGRVHVAARGHHVGDGASVQCGAVGRVERQIVDGQDLGAAAGLQLGGANGKDVLGLVWRSLRLHAAIAVHQSQHVSQGLVAGGVRVCITHADVHLHGVVVIPLGRACRAPAIAGEHSVVVVGFGQEQQHATGHQVEGVVQLLHQARCGGHPQPAQEAAAVRDAGGAVGSHDARRVGSVRVGGAAATGQPRAGDEAAGQVGVIVLHAGIHIGHDDARAVQADARQPGQVAGVGQVCLIYVVGRHLVAQLAAQPAVSGLELDAVDAGHAGSLP